MQSGALGEMIDGHQPEGAKAPEYESVGDSRQRALAGHFALKQHFPNEIPNPAADWLELEFRIILRRADRSPYVREAIQESENGCGQQQQEQGSLRPGELNHKLRV